MDHSAYDAARESDENTPRGHKRGGYVSRQITKRLNADVTPDVVKKLANIPANTQLLVHYDNKAGFAGRLLGILTFMDGHTTGTAKVWESELHHQVLQLMGEKTRLAKIETKPSNRWGDSLMSITKIEEVG